MDRLNGFDLLRAIAILWVMLFHAWVAGLGLPFLAVAKFGWMGVDLFFALSGYLIGSQLFKSCAQGVKPSLKQFYLRRAFRVLPAYWVVVILYFTVPLFREEPNIQPLWQFVTFTENLFIDYRNNRAFSHAWSLCIEEHFYLFFPLIVLVLMRKPSMKKAASVCLALLIGGIALRGYFWLVELTPFRKGEGNSIGFGPRYFELIYYPTYSRLDGLLAGVSVAAVRYFRPEWWTKCMQKGNLLLCLGLMGFVVSLWMFQGRYSFVGSVFGFPLLSASFALLVAAAVSPRTILGSVRIPFAETIATLAYSLYLINKQVFHLTQYYLGDWVANGGYQALLVHSVLVFIAAAALYWLIERPFLRFRDKVDGLMTRFRERVLA